MTFRNLTAAGIILLPFAAGLSISALFAGVIRSILGKHLLGANSLLVLFVIVVVLQAAMALLGRWIWRLSSNWQLYGLGKVRWQLLFTASYILGLFAIVLLK